jgi:hypothetical protein
MENKKFHENYSNASLPKALNKNFFNLKIFNKIIFAIVIILGVSYIIGFNGLTIKGFTLNELKLEHNKIAEENKKLELEAMTLSSYGNISDKINNLKMVAVGKVDYINGRVETVAKK